MKASGERFAEDLTRTVASAGLPKNARLGLAVSGGPDSMALLVLAHRVLPDRIAAASVNHGLRPEAAAECAHVAAVCRGLNVPHCTLTVTISTEGNLQSQARMARYQALSDWAGRQDIAAVLTAHHADDQAETLIMRLARGSGVRGLAGMRTVAAVPGGSRPLLRPLLAWRRQELIGVVTDAGIEAVDDPSNQDPQFLRVRVRRWLSQLPDGVDSRRIAASAAHLGEDDFALDWAARREWDERVTRHDDELLYRPTGPVSIRLRVLTRIIDKLAHEGRPRGDEIFRLDQRLKTGDTATLAGVKCTGDGSVWRFRTAPQRRGANPR